MSGFVPTDPASNFAGGGFGPFDPAAGGTGGSGFRPFDPNASSVSAEVQAVFDRMSALTGTERNAIEGFVNGMVTEGLWADVFEFYAPCLNNTDYLTGFLTDTLVESAAPPTHVAGEYIDFTNNTQHVLEGRNFETYSTPNIFFGCYNVFTAADTVNNSDLFGIENGGAQTYMRWRGNDDNNFNEYIGDITPGTRTDASQRPTGDFVGLGRSGTDMLNLQPGGLVDQGIQAFVVHPTGGPVQWHGIWTNGAPAGGNMANARYSCMMSMAAPAVSEAGKVRNLVLNFLIAIGVPGVPVP